MAKKKYFGYTVGEAPRYAYYPGKEIVGIIRCPDNNIVWPVNSWFLVNARIFGLWNTSELAFKAIGIENNTY